MEKGDRTRDVLLDCALASFRTKGFDATTMRDIAAAAGVSLGSTYYYFASKEALVAAYYKEMQDAHDAALGSSLPGISTLGDRLRLIWTTKLALIEEDRGFLGALFRFTGEPGHPLSVLSQATSDVRDRSIRMYRVAVEGFVDVPARVEQLANGLWFAHLGLILHALNDTTPGLARTRALVELGADLVEQLVAISTLPFAGTLIDGLVARLDALPKNPITDDVDRTIPLRRPSGGNRSKR